MVQAAAEATTVVENELYRITFSNRGGQAISWQLKRRPDAPNSVFKDSDGKPLDLVHQQAAKQFGYPLSLYTYDPGADDGLAAGAVCAVGDWDDERSGIVDVYVLRWDDRGTEDVHVR